MPEGRAGLAYPGIDGDRGFREAVYLCGLRQNARDRSNLAFQNMGTTADGNHHPENHRVFRRSRRRHRQGPGNHGAWPRRVSPVFAGAGDRGQRLRPGGAGRRQGSLLCLRRHQRPDQLRRLLRLPGRGRLAGGQPAPHPAGDRRGQRVLQRIDGDQLLPRDQDPRLQLRGRGGSPRRTTRPASA